MSDFATAEIHKLQQENARLLDALNQQNTLTCVYCGHAYPPGTPTHGSSVLTEHIKVCPKHPMRALEAENARLATEADNLDRVREANAIKHGEQIAALYSENARLKANIDSMARRATELVNERAKLEETNAHLAILANDNAMVGARHKDRADAAEVENARLKEKLTAVAAILAEWGCDCDPGPGGQCCDHEVTCEQAGHEPCLGHRIERAIQSKALVR